MRASLAASTVTPGSTAPVGSLTVPVIDACASTIRGARITNAIVHSHLPRAGTSAPSLPDNTTAEDASSAVGTSEVERHVEPHEPGRQNRRRIVPGRAVRGAELILILVRGAVVRVQQVGQVQADVRPPAAEPEGLGEPHVDLRPAIVGIQPVVAVVEQRDG